MEHTTAWLTGVRCPHKYDPRNGPPLKRPQEWRASVT